jgi:cyclic-di-GMP-binding protein
MPSFDTKLEADFVEVKNAVENTAKEIGTRFDFKGTSAGIELKDKEITLFGDADFPAPAGRGHPAQQADQAQRGCALPGRRQGREDRRRQGQAGVKVRNGIASEDAKKIQQAIKNSKMKVQAAIQGDTVRVTGAKRDDLQAAMA